MNYMHKREVKSVQQKHFAPKKELVDYMKNRLQIERKKSELRLRGEELSKEDELRERKLRTDKTRILDKIIFQSMADLTYFLDSIPRQSNLQSIFEDDLKDLFGIRRNNPNAQNRGFMFGKLMTGIMSWDPLAIDPRVKDKRNFRLTLLRILQGGIFDLIMQLTIEEFPAHTAKIISEDLARAVAWIDFYASRVEEDKDILPHRTFEYRSIN
jgi:hypothetical protein